jgi:hypothetical protein
MLFAYNMGGILRCLAPKSYLGTPVICRLPKQLWFGQIKREQKYTLKFLTESYGLSIAAGDISLLENRWYVTHSGLIRLAQRRGCCGITVQLVPEVSDSASCRWVFRAIVYKQNGTKKFVGYGDADPSNVSSVVHGSELRIAETRAVNRALRKAYGIGICSVEELGSTRFTNSSPEYPKEDRQPQNHNGASNGQSRLRDRLRLLIRDHKLDPALVKAYAADFCGTATLSGASRELVESFISHLTRAAKENPDGLVCKLNSYAQPEAHP